MKIVYFGTSDFAVPSLKAAADHTVLVVTQPDRPTGRGLKLKASPVKEAALELGLPVENPERARAKSYRERLESLDADLFVVASYGQILSQRLLDTPSIACINVHASILPKHRGASPIQSAILAGDEWTGVSLMEMEAGVDTGPVIAQECVSIGPSETAGELHDRLAEIGGNLLAAWLPTLARGEYAKTTQSEAEATHAPKFERDDARLDWNAGAKGAFDRYRAFTPVPGAYVETDRGPLKILRASKIVEGSTEPSAILAVRGGLTVGFGSGALRLELVQPHGKRPMSGTDYANGVRLRPGDMLLKNARNSDG